MLSEGKLSVSHRHDTPEDPFKSGRTENGIAPSLEESKKIDEFEPINAQSPISSSKVPPFPPSESEAAKDSRHFSHPSSGQDSEPPVPALEED